jgi:hypothetical protein
MNLLTNFIDHDTVTAEENIEKTEKAKIEKTIDNLPIKDKEDLISLIDYRRED